MARRNLDPEAVDVAVGYVRDDELNFQALVLEADGSAPQIEVQRSLASDGDDVSRGWNDHCLVVDSGPVSYGAVRGWRIVGDRLLLELHETGAAELGVARSIEYRLTGEDRGLIEAHLSEILGLQPV